MTMERKRSDHRTKPYGGPWGDYLLNDYPRRLDWVEDGPAFVPQQLHRTARNASGYVHLEGGKPAMTKAWLNHLSGVPWQDVEKAIEIVRATDPEAIAALEYYQLPDALRPSRYAWAAARHINETTITDWYQRAVRKVGEVLRFVVRKEGGQ